jgi:flagellar biosynthesis component FlhA
MATARAVLYIAAIILLVLAALPIQSRVSLALVGAACALLAFALPDIAGGFH